MKTLINLSHLILCGNIIPIVLFGGILCAPKARATLFAPTITSAADCAKYLDDLTNTFTALAQAKEAGFWATKMGLTGASNAQYGIDDEAMGNFSRDPSHILSLQTALARNDLSEYDRNGLQGWLNFFNAQTIVDSESRRLHQEMRDLENKLQEKLSKVKKGYTDPETHQFIEASIVELSSQRDNDPNEARRRAAFEGMRAYEHDVWRLGFLDILKARLRLAQALGYPNYYEMQLQRRERMTETELFSLFADLEEHTREPHAKTMADIAARLGATALEPWNYKFYTSGDLTRNLDPYFPFEASLPRWLQTFAGLGADFNGAEVHVDLVDRKNKYSNGFMHIPFAPYRTREGRFLPARINLMSNALPAQVGSGKSATETLFHEGGHTLHFSNVDGATPAYSQEFAPTTAQYAETQSMFMDSLVNDADWLHRYAKTSQGETIPKELIIDQAVHLHSSMTFDIRWLMTVPVVERYLYSLPESSLTPENVETILQRTREIEVKYLGINGGSPRPVYSVVHLLEEDSSAAYHGYLVAQLGVNQTRKYFFEKYGYILDNPNICPELKRAYWAPGNSIPFQQMIQNLTGKPFSAQATIELAARTKQEVIDEVDRTLAKEKTIAHNVNGLEPLNVTIFADHGDEQIVNNAGRGATGVSNLEQLGVRFSNWIASLRAGADTP